MRIILAVSKVCIRISTSWHTSEALPPGRKEQNDSDCDAENSESSQTNNDDICTPKNVCNVSYASINIKMIKVNEFAKF